MKKIFVSFILLFCFVIFIIFTDFLAYSIDYASTVKRAKTYNTSYLPFKYRIVLNKFSKENFLNFHNNIYRKSLNTDSQLKPIYIFGCSYAYGHYLKDEETFGAKLAQYTNRPVYNFAYPGWGIQHSLFLLQNLKFPETKQPEYIIYVYMSDHIRRMNAKWFAATDDSQNLVYKDADGVLVEKSCFSAFYLYRKFTALFNSFYCKDIRNKEILYNRFLKYIDNVQNEIQKKFPESKFIIVVYDDNLNFDWSEIEKKDIKVIKVNDIVKDIYSPKYMRKDMHPNRCAWEVLTPKIIKESKIL